jgi:hypothetical protein
VEVTWAKIVKQALGVIGIPPSEFYNMTFWDYQRLAEGYQLRHAGEMHKVRLIMFAVVNAAGAKLRPEQIIEIPLLDGNKEADWNRLRERFYAEKKKEHG